MPIQPNGTYLRQMGALSGSDVWQQRAAQANPIISASEHDAEMNDVATAISGCVKANGTTAATANLPMGGHRHTGVGNATADDQYAALGQVKSGLSFSDVTVTANSAITALKVTQTGAGEAFRVEDETSPDATPFVITATGDVGVGTGSPTHKLHVSGVTRLGNNLISTDSLEINSQGSGDRSSYIDFHAQDSVDYNARIIRASGANGALTVSNLGTGALNINSAGPANLVGGTTVGIVGGTGATVLATTNNASLVAAAPYASVLSAGTRSLELTQANGAEVQSSTGNYAGFIKTNEAGGTSEGLVFYAARGSGSVIFRTNDSGETDQLEISNAGNVVFHGDIRANANAASNIGTSGLQFNNIYCVDLIESSDERLKNSIEDSVLGLDFIKALRPVSYKLNEAQNIRGKDENGNTTYTPREGLRPHYGLIAQEVKAAIDAAGVDFGGWKLADKDDPTSKQMLSYTQFIAPLIQAVKELSAQVEDLQDRLAAVEGA